MKLYHFIFPVVLLLGFGCNTSKKTVNVDPQTEIVEERNLDTLEVSAPMPDRLKSAENYELPDYNESHTRIHDLLHTKLDLRFDWAKQQVIGKATITLTPYFYSSSELTLDAVNFDIHKITFDKQSTALKYEYDGKKLVIDLGKTFSKGEEYTLFIDYTAKPADGPTGGSAAITSDQGLYFINHDGSIPDKPMQIWTQGETQSNSRWFPTIDKPNERCTEEIYLTVEDKYETLSNGVLVSSIKNTDGTRTDYWKMDMPHAPYLFMIAIGDYAVVNDKWEGIPVDYFVEHKYKDDAREIYKNTVPMLSFFSNLLNYRYPWQKYSQVIVRDYVSGAMENTTGVIFGEFMQGTTRELIDNSTNELVVAHEMFHHWFGDLVTCESWANLTLNEGFANYSEYLWFEHQYGADKADHHRLNELNGYIGSTRQGGTHPLIYFGYENREDMFDAHSYNKGGLVLHMLRNYTGDEAFFTALNLYLKTHEYTAVEAHDLRLAFEEVTGEDLNWFFNQWFFSEGHPMLEISYDYDAASSQASVTIEQLQDPEKGSPAIFILPMAIDIYTGAGKATRHKVKMDKRKQTFTFDVASAPKLITADADRMLLAEIRDNKTDANYIFQYQNSPKFLDRYDALKNLSQMDDAAVTAVFKKALDDPYWELRRMAINEMDPTDADVQNSLMAMATGDKNSFVRSEAILALAETGDTKYIATAKQIIDKDQAYRVISAALEALNILDETAALEYASRLEKETDANLLVAVGKIYAASGDVKYLPFFERGWTNIDGFQVIDFFENYGVVLQNADAEQVSAVLPKLEKVSLNMDVSPWKRFAATKTMHELRESYREQMTDADEATQADLQQSVNLITEKIEMIKEKETSDQLKMIYNNF